MREQASGFGEYLQDRGATDGAGVVCHDKATPI